MRRGGRGQGVDHVERQVGQQVPGLVGGPVGIRGRPPGQGRRREAWGHGEIRIFVTGEKSSAPRARDKSRSQVPKSHLTWTGRDGGRCGGRDGGRRGGQEVDSLKVRSGFPTSHRSQPTFRFCLKM